MRNRVRLASSLAAILIAWVMATAATAAPRGEYVGQPPPGAIPALFAPGFVSTDLCERDITFSPDGREIYYTLQGGAGFADWYAAIVFTRQESGGWTPPRVAPFSGRYNDVEPCVTPDGKRLYFASNRPREGAGEPRTDYDIWFVERTPAGWGEPRNVGAPVNTDRDEFYPSLTRDGTLYLTASYGGDRSGEGIWRARPVDGRFAQPASLGDSVNTAAGEYNAFVAPDERYVIFGRRGDLLVSFHRDDGTWTRARTMGPAVNSANLDYCPSLSPDGKYLFFTSTRPPDRDYARVPPGFNALVARVSDLEHRKMLRIRLFPYEDLYWVRSDILETLRQEALR